MENNKNVTLFDYKNIKVRTVIIDGDVWFVAKDVCDILEIKNPTDALSSLSDKMKMTLEWKESILGITEDPNTVRILLVSEPGMYNLSDQWFVIPILWDASIIFCFCFFLLMLFIPVRVDLHIL